MTERMNTAPAPGREGALRTLWTVLLCLLVGTAFVLHLFRYAVSAGSYVIVVAALAAFAGASAMAELKDGTTFRLGTVPNELVAEWRMGDPVRFSLEENASTGF